MVERPKPSTAITSPAVDPVKRRHSQNAIRHPSMRPDKEVQENQTGKCVVCGGKVVDSTKIHEAGSGRHSMTNLDFHCEVCGIKYDFLPPKILKKK
jgi:hypothetical protein